MKSQTRIILLFLVFQSISLNAQIKNNVINRKVEDTYALNEYFSGGDFIENRGQMLAMDNTLVPFVLFKKSGSGLDLFITTSGITFLFAQSVKDKEPLKKVKWERIDLELKGAIISKENIIKHDESKSDNSYYLGHCPDGIKKVKGYNKITIQNIYPNIDWVLTNTSEKGYKYDFILHEGADPDDIELIYRSKTKLELKLDGSLMINTALGNLIEKAPVSYFNAELISTDFKLKSEYNEITQGYDSQLSFNVDEEITKKIKNKKIKNELIVDPEVVWDTFYGNDGAIGALCADTDNDDNLFIVGYANGGTNFPTVDAGTYFQGEMVPTAHGFILKFDEAGVPIWATYYGGSTYETRLESMAFDEDYNLFIAGWTTASDCPVYDNGTYFQDLDEGALILKFDSEGNRLWATNYGGDTVAKAMDIACDSEGNIFICGNVEDASFPLDDAGTYFEDYNASEDVFLLKFDNMGNRLWASCYGGTYIDRAYSLTINDFDEVFVTGFTNSPEFATFDAGTYFQEFILTSISQGFILKFDNDGTRLWATCYGGNNERNYLRSIGADHNNNIAVLGMTTSIDFPVLDAGTYFDETWGGAYDMTIVKFDRFGNRTWGTYFGGESFENTGSFDNLEFDQCGNLYISFNTTSVEMPIINDCYGTSDSTANGSTDLFVAKFNTFGTLIWSTFLGGANADFREAMALDNNSNIYIAGERVFDDPLIDGDTYPLVNPGLGSYFDDTPSLGDNLGITKFSFNQLEGVFKVISDTCSSGVGSATVNLSDGSDCPKTFVWSSGETITTADSSNTIEGKLSGYYNVTVTSGCATLFSDSVFIPDYNVEPVLDLGADTSICEHATDTLYSGHPEADNYWQDGSSEPFFYPEFSGEFWVRIDSAGCIATDTITINILHCLDIESNQLDNVIIYPNPFKNSTVVTFGRELVDPSRIVIYNSLGQSVYQVDNITGTRIEIKNENFASGTYILSLYNSNSNEIYTTKLIVR
ncbi:DUF7948 domain-containing protein [Crocinitomix catalasitica]|uniref:DUF7948 domain-containing protein n=1 Tax=Crocinitomix catalasitica TaxID=184607 RepID=UPI000489E284|nr:SBBP repeat-containing protein [Crocinitomix catalasitica]